MKRVITLCLAFLIIFSFVACDENNHDGQSKTPSGSSIQKKRNYQDVINEFEQEGFTNIKTEILDDLITGWVTKDGSVESVSVDGDVNYSSDTWYPNNVEVIITYHTFPQAGSSVQDNETEPTETTIVPNTSTTATSEPEITNSPDTSTTTSNPQTTNKPDTSPPALLSVVYVSSPIGRNETATLTIKGKPNTVYSINVYYSTTISKAEGLNNKPSDTSGSLSWSWKIGASTKTGKHKIVIKGGGEEITIYFTTTE